MNRTILQLFDWFLDGLHLTVLGLNLFGWLYRPWWKWHRRCVALTLLSWVVLGAFYGVPGYCILTDWHWQVKRALGAENLPHSYIAYILEWFDITVPRGQLNQMVGITFGVICVIALIEALSEKRKKPRNA